MIKHGILRGTDTQVSMTRIIYTTQELVVEAFYKNNYWDDKLQYSLSDKCIVANYVVLSIILQVLGCQTKLTAIMQP